MAYNLEIGFFHEGKLQDKMNLADGKKFSIQSVWHNCSDIWMNTLYNTAFSIAPLVMYLYYHNQQYNNKET